MYMIKRIAPLVLSQSPGLVLINVKAVPTVFRNLGRYYTYHGLTIGTTVTVGPPPVIQDFRMHKFLKRSVSNTPQLFSVSV